MVMSKLEVKRDLARKHMKLMAKQCRASAAGHLALAEFYEHRARAASDLDEESVDLVIAQWETLIDIRNAQVDVALNENVIRQTLRTLAEEESDAEAKP